jgi:hypothetical protein
MPDNPPVSPLLRLITVAEVLVLLLQFPNPLTNIPSQAWRGYLSRLRIIIIAD